MFYKKRITELEQRIRSLESDIKTLVLDTVRIEELVRFVIWEVCAGKEKLTPEDISKRALKIYNDDFKERVENLRL